MKKIITSVFLLSYVLLISMAFAQQESGQAASGTGMIIPAAKILNESVPGYIITQSGNYIKSFVGSDYFNKHLILTGNSSMQSGTGTIFYNVYYTYNISSNYLSSPALRYVLVSLDKNGNTINYIGPKKPHEFRVSRDQAVQIAKQMGLKDPIIAKIGRVMASNSIDGYTWVVTGSVDNTNCRAIGGTQECLIPGIYIDVDNASVIKGFNSSSLIREPVSKPEVGWNGTGTAGHPVGTNTVLITGIIAFFVLISIIWYRFYKNSKKQKD